MVTVEPSLAFFFPSGQEWMLILLIGIMLFGRRLPEVGRTVGRTVAQLRQGLNKLKQEVDLDSEVRDLSKTVRDAKSKVAKAVEAPRKFGNPTKMLSDLTDEALSSHGPGEELPTEELKTEIKEIEESLTDFGVPEPDQTRQ